MSLRIVSLKRMSTPAAAYPRMPADGRRKILTLDDCVDVLKRIDNGESCRSIAAAVNCGKSQISRTRSSEGMGEWRQIRPEICETP